MAARMQQLKRACKSLIACNSKIRGRCNWRSLNLQTRMRHGLGGIHIVILKSEGRAASSHDGSWELDGRP